MRPSIPLLVAVLCCVAIPATAATNVTGTLWMSVHARARAAGAVSPPRQPGVGEGVVWVETIPDRLEAKLASPPKKGWFARPAAAPPLPDIVERADGFSPRVRVVPAGTQVEFTNADRLYHSVFSVSSARHFDLGKSAPGRRDTLAFARTGVINLHCEIHPEAIGFLVVTPNHAFATPDSAGRFALPRLSPGRYVLHAWHPRAGELKLPFDVPRRGTVALDPSF
jgi:hypothetical protein